MFRRFVCGLLLGLAVGCGGGTNPTPMVSVTFPGNTIFIADTVQFTARSTSNETRDVTNEATWGSDAPQVATVSSTGLVTAVAAGEASIFADFEGARGTLKIRVYPNFDGSWAGNEVVASCEASGTFEGFCDQRDFRIGEVFQHHSSFSQNEASVQATIVTGPDTSAMADGTISIDGQLQLPSTPSLPADPVVNAEVQNWHSRADTPSRMTGSYDGFFTAPGVPGSVKVGLRLENVVKTSATTSMAPLSTRNGEMLQQGLRRMVEHLNAQR